jgi:hypothetical protein
MFEPPHSLQLGRFVVGAEVRTTALLAAGALFVVYADALTPAVPAIIFDAVVGALLGLPPDRLLLGASLALAL